MKRELLFRKYYLNRYIYSLSLSVLILPLSSFTEAYETNEFYHADYFFSLKTDDGQLKDEFASKVPQETCSKVRHPHHTPPKEYWTHIASEEHRNIIAARSLIEVCHNYVDWRAAVTGRQMKCDRVSKYPAMIHHLTWRGTYWGWRSGSTAAQRFYCSNPNSAKIDLCKVHDASIPIDMENISTNGKFCFSQLEQPTAELEKIHCDDDNGIWLEKWFCKPPYTRVVTNNREMGNTACPSRDTVGNPISISSGNKYQQETLLSGYLPLNLSYNSADQKWRHNYGYSLKVSSTAATLIRTDGKGLSFTKTENLWAADDGDVFYTLTAFDNGEGSAWKVTTPSGSIELYDAEGKVLSITSLQGQKLTFTHSANSSVVTDSFGNQLALTLEPDGKLTSAALNGIAQASLSYDTEGRLVSRTDAQNSTIQYHYEDTNFPNHLTGITGADGQRFATWAYDAEGRGILSEHVGQERAELVFHEDGSTTVTNSLGKQTTYHYEEIEGLKRPTMIEGHASDNCVAANQAYTYYPTGQVETQTDWSGNITRFEYNDRGLITRKVVAEGTAEEQVTTQVWDATLPLLQKRTSSGVTMSYQYDAQNNLVGTEEQAAIAN